MTIVVTMAKLLFTMAVGFYLNRKNILDQETSKKMSAMVVNFSMVVARLVHAPSDCRGVYQCMVMLANTAFIGYPVVQALYGESAIFYTTIFNFGYNVLFYTYASFLLDRDAGQASRFEPKRLLSAGLLAGIAALIIPFSGISLPDIILQPCSFIGSITTPMSMLIVGSNMANYPIHDIFSEKKIYIMAFIRLLVMPILTAVYMSFLTKDPLLICMTSMTIGMPVGSMVAMASSKYEKQGRIGSISVVMTTICSMATIPVLAVIFKLWFGV